MTNSHINGKGPFLLFHIAIYWSTKASSLKLSRLSCGGIIVELVRHQPTKTIHSFPIIFLRTLFIYLFIVEVNAYSLAQTCHSSTITKVIEASLCMRLDISHNKVFLFSFSLLVGFRRKRLVLNITCEVEVLLAVR